MLDGKMLKYLKEISGLSPSLVLGKKCFGLLFSFGSYIRATKEESSYMASIFTDLSVFAWFSTEDSWAFCLVLLKQSERSPALGNNQTMLSIMVHLRR